MNSLDVDPRDGSLLLTTNRGFWRIDSGEGHASSGSAARSRPAKQSSTVGTFLELKATGPGHRSAPAIPTSGHAPQFLGLIASDDAGRTWRVVSRLGDADLHKIVLKHDRLYAFDAVLGAMLISGDGGRRSRSSSRRAG